MGLARAWNRTLVYFGVAEPEDTDFPPHPSSFKSVLGLFVGAVVAGALFGFVDHDVADGAILRRTLARPDDLPLGLGSSPRQTLLAVVSLVRYAQRGGCAPHARGRW